jgi:hypothetical protein
MKKIGFLVFIGIVFLVSSCATAPGGLTQYEQFSRAFSDEINKAKANINIMSNYISELSGYEKRIGALSDADYNTINKIIDSIPAARNNMETQIQIAKDTGNSVTPDGCYSNTGKKVHGWDNAAYINLHVGLTLSSLDQERSQTMQNYNAINAILFEKPNKPFNANAAALFAKIRIDISLAESDIAAKNWKEAKTNTDNANNRIKSAINLDLNNIELYQTNAFQDKLKSLTSQITLASVVNTTGTILKDAGEGAAGILDGIGSMFKGIGNALNK